MTIIQAAHQSERKNDGHASLCMQTSKMSKGSTKKEPSTIPGDLQNELFTFVGVDIMTGDIVAMLGDVLEVLKSKEERQILRLTPRIKTLLNSSQKFHSHVLEVIRLSHHKTFLDNLKSRTLNDQWTASKREARLTGTSGTTSTKSEPLCCLEIVS
jgi:hypothetical protein